MGTIILHWLTGFKVGLTTLDHYLDDFIFAGSSEIVQLLCPNLFN